MADYDVKAACEAYQVTHWPDDIVYHGVKHLACLCPQLQAAYDAGKADRTTCDSTSPGAGIDCIRLEGHDPLFHIGPNGATWKSARGETDGN